MLHAAARDFFPDVLLSTFTDAHDTSKGDSSKWHPLVQVSLYSGGDLGPYRVLDSFCSQSAVTPANSILVFLMRAATVSSNTAAEPHSEHRRRSFAR
jgi:hypothetical protein